MISSLKKNKSGQLDTSFGWLFAIVVGGFILFLAIFGVMKFINIQKTVQSAETGKSISVLLNPLETGFESGEKVLISSSVETRIIMQCDTQGTFGKQKIQTLQKSLGDWSDTGVNIVLKNKYIFSNTSLEGESFYAFSKPYEFPVENDYDSAFKIADLIYLTSADEIYCFYNPPSDIETELGNLNIENILIDSCTTKGTKVCFDSGESNCDIKVGYDSGTIIKNSTKMYFDGDALMYAAIFSTPEIYECQVERFMKRANLLLQLYYEKNRIESIQGCSSDVASSLNQLSVIIDNYENSSSLVSVSDAAKKLNKLNGNAGDCKLW